jgi:glycosyltransferase involved in cell wall biosynthesis
LVSQNGANRIISRKGVQRLTKELVASVIVSTRNRAQYLSDCLQSLARQDCAVPFEIIVIDNASTDETPRLIDEWRRKDPRFRTFRETRLGLSAAKNAGASLAAGRLLLFTDDDVIVAPNWIRAYVDLFARIGETNALAGGPVIPVLKDLRPWPDWFDEQALADVGLLDHRTERTLGKFEYVWGANMAIPACVFKRIGRWNEGLGRRGEERGTFEDTEYQDRLKAEGGNVWFCPPARLEHRIELDRIRPRNVVQTEFTRGRNQFCLEVMLAYGSMEKAPRSNTPAAMAKLFLALTVWLFWTGVFRLTRNRSIFCRTLAAGFASGECLERMRAGRHSSLLHRALSRVSFLFQGLILRLTPNGAS